MTNRIKSNIIELEKLYETPCAVWLKRFKNGRLNAHIAFLQYEERYEWLYNNSPYDLIGWEIQNNCFDWVKHSDYVAIYCPENFDPDRFNWRDYSWIIAKYAPIYFDPDRYNWAKHSWAVSEFCPDKLQLKK